ncbi:MAG: helicase C-terminal domain-containing protein [Paracoccaceae bacterium]
MDDPFFNALRVKFGYAITCHKAQGSEWDTAIVSCTSLGNPRGGRQLSLALHGMHAREIAPLPS